jgi:septum formation protein
MRLILASASPRRAELLTAAGFPFEVLAVDVDERVRAAEPPGDYVCRLASEKSARALDVVSPPAEAGRPDRRSSGLLVLGADTAVVVDGEILGKPADSDAAKAMLTRLSGRSHQVMTGVSLRSCSREVGGVETTTVWFSTLDARRIAWYVGTGEGADKAGAYAIQGLASRFIPRIDGSYTNVVGLPVALVAAMIERIQSG